MSNDNNFDLGYRIKAERERANLSQAAFASIGEVTRTSQINYEQDKRKPDADYLAKLATAGIDVEYILTGTPSAAALTPDEIRLLSLFREASLELKAAAIGTLSAGSQINTGAARQIFHGEVKQVVEGDSHNANFSTNTIKIKKDKK